MAEIINLKAKRKDAAKQQARRQADANSVKFGRTKAQKHSEAHQAARARAELDGKKLGPD